jgi:hypothetical protein
MLNLGWHCDTAHVIEADAPAYCTECGARLGAPEDLSDRSDEVMEGRFRRVRLCRKLRDEARKLHDEMASLREG